MLLKIPTLRWLYVGFGVRSFVNYALLTWLSSVFHALAGHRGGQGRIWAVGATALMSIISVPRSVGVLADRWHKEEPERRMLACWP